MGDWEAFQFDLAVLSVGSEVEVAFDENAAKPKKKRKKPEIILRQVLGYDGIGPQYADLSTRSDIKSAKRKKGETDLEALLRLEREAKKRG